MKSHKTRSCQECGTGYKPTGPAAKYCKTCAPLKAKQSAKRASDKHRASFQKVGVGSGGNQYGDKNPNWRGGVAAYRKKRETTCNRCDAPAVLVHHIDHDRNNNTDSNLESLCKRCHQIEHKCWKNFEGSETIGDECSRVGIK